MKKRIIAKETTVGRHKLWGVYDVERASWPALIPGYGQVRQHMTSQEEAEAEAAKFEEWLNGPGKILR